MIRNSEMDASCQDGLNSGTHVSKDVHQLHDSVATCESNHLPAVVDDYDDNSDEDGTKGITNIEVDVEEVDGITASSEAATSSSARYSHGRDRYGFLASDELHQNIAPVSQQVLQQRLEKEEERLQKWKQMQMHWPRYYKQEQKLCKAKARARKGIPNSVRGWAWYQFCNAAKAKRLHPDPFNNIDTSKVPAQTADEIDRDIDRTFPRHELFSEDGGVGQQSLRKLLLHYAVLDPAVGYCQGMGFIAAMLLIYMNEEDAFHCFYAILNRRTAPLRLFYLPKLIQMQRVLHVFEALGRKHLKRLWTHMHREGMDPSMYFTEWAMTMYTRGFSFELVTRVWDVLLSDCSIKIMYRVALGLLKYFETELLQLKFEEMMSFVRELSRRVDAHEVMDVAWAIPLKTADIDRFASEFDARYAADEEMKSNQHRDSSSY